MEDDDASMDASELSKCLACVSSPELNRPADLESGSNFKSNRLAKAGLGYLLVCLLLQGYDLFTRHTWEFHL